MIYVEDELIKLNGVVLPGLVKSIEVIETAKVDEQEVEGSATKPKQATGYEDAKVNIELIIDDTPSQTKYQRYATLRAIFRSPGQSVPQPIPIISCRLLSHRRISRRYSAMIAPFHLSCNYSATNYVIYIIFAFSFRQLHQSSALFP